MNFKELEIPEMVIAEIFKTSLIQGVNPAAMALDNIQPSTLKAGNKSSSDVIIAVHSPGSDDIPVEQFSFLSIVLNACQLNINDAIIINTAKQSMRLPDVNSLKPKIMLLFNTTRSLHHLTPEPLPFAITIIDEYPVLSLPDLSKFILNNDESKQLKIKLWTALKQIFNV
ncbi:MAG: hypothetical protein WKF97_06585 [Chitinophagaceae bacterium]